MHVYICTAYQNFLVPTSPDRSRLYEWGYFINYEKKRILCCDAFVHAFLLRSKCIIIVVASYALVYCSVVLPESINWLGNLDR